MAMRWLLVAFLIALAGLPSTRVAAAEGTCPKAGTLGVSRTVEIDTTGGPGFGMEHYKAYDFLQPKEVVLTFDDGPQKFSTESVLQALNDECVKATFFSIGMMALGYPEIIREVAKAGHTVGTHTWSHKALAKLKTFDEAKDEIERGISGVKRAVGGPIAPFFRFPTLVDTPETVAYLGKRNIAMFSTDIDSFDFKPQTAEHVVKSVMEKLDKRGKGIILMHDIHKTTAKALPMLLAELKAKGYKIVHVTAKGQVATLPEYDAAIEKEAKGLPQVGAERPLSNIVKTVEGTPPADSPAQDPHAVTEPSGMPTASPAEPAAATPPLPAFSTTAPASPPAAPPAAPHASGPAAALTPAAPAGEDQDMSASPPKSPPAVTTTATIQPPPSTAVTAEPANSGVVGPPATTSSVVRTVGEPSADGKPAATGEPAAASQPTHQASKIADGTRQGDMAAVVRPVAGQ